MSFYSDRNNINNNNNLINSNDYSNRYLHTDLLPQSHVRNITNPLQGYPKLQKLTGLKKQQILKYQIKPFGIRIQPSNIINKLNELTNNYKLCFDVIMLGCLDKNQTKSIYQILNKLPIDKLCSKPGFLFIWSTTENISELTKLLNNNNNNWGKKFRRSEELVFVPVSKEKSYYYPGDFVFQQDTILESTQWHCWMCITGTVRRATDGHLIHCNIDTDLQIENISSASNNAVPPNIYQVAENFSSSTRRLHIIPTSLGMDHPIKMRPGWVIMSPDVLLDNFNVVDYKAELDRVGSNLPTDMRIESLRPKSPPPKN